MKVIGRKCWPRPQGNGAATQRAPNSSRKLAPFSQMGGSEASLQGKWWELPSGYETLVDMEHDPFRADIYDPIIDRFIPSYPHDIPRYPMVFLALFSSKYPFFPFQCHGHYYIMVIIQVWSHVHRCIILFFHYWWSYLSQSMNHLSLLPNLNLSVKDYHHY